MIPSRVSVMDCETACEGVGGDGYVESIVTPNNTSLCCSDFVQSHIIFSTKLALAPVSGSGLSSTSIPSSVCPLLSNS
jgi:hypothetical protein